ncbi:MAG: Do family protease, partial [Hyphomonadaceae bacterium]
QTGAIDGAARRRHNITADVRGALVLSVSPRGPSFGQIRKGDVIVEAGFQDVPTARAFKELVEAAEAQPNVPLLMHVIRDGRSVFVSVVLDV